MTDLLLLFWKNLVEQRGFEPLTSSVRGMRSPAELLPRQIIIDIKSLKAIEKFLKNVKMGWR